MASRSASSGCFNNNITGAKTLVCKGFGARHEIDTLRGVFCFLGYPMTPKSQTGCPRGHPKILQGCHFYTKKKIQGVPCTCRAYGPKHMNF